MRHTLTPECLSSVKFDGKHLIHVLLESKEDMELGVFMGFLAQFFTEESIEEVIPRYWYNPSIAFN